MDNVGFSRAWPAGIDWQLIGFFVDRAVAWAGTEEAPQGGGLCHHQGGKLLFPVAACRLCAMVVIPTSSGSNSSLRCMD